MEKFWINGWWTETFEEAQAIAAQFAGTAGYDRISYSADGTTEALTSYATAAADGTWWIVSQTADAAVTCFEMVA